MRCVFIEAEKKEYPVRMLCRMLQVSPAAYYRWTHRSSERANKDLEMRARIVQIHSESGSTYGAPRITEHLRGEGEICNRKRIARLMLQEQLSGLRRPRFRRSPRATDDVPDLVKRAFHATAPNLLWMADVTQIATAEGWLFFAAVVDAFSRRVVGWAMGDTVDTELVMSALDMAIQQRRPERGLIHHSDRGGPYISLAFGDALRDSGIRRSFGAAKTCFDNAAMESFFATLKKDLVYRRRLFPTKAEARWEVFAYVEAFYNRRRIHSYLNYLAPAAFEQDSGAAA